MRQSKDGSRNATCRLADEYDAAQDRGDVAKNGGNRRNQHVARIRHKNSAKDILGDGVTRKQICEDRAVREAANPVAPFSFPLRSGNLASRDAQSSETYQRLRTRQRRVFSRCIRSAVITRHHEG
jgi:hypothetical protein